jgi:hypothetical protein
MRVRNWRYSVALAGLILVLGARGESFAEQPADTALESKLAKLEARIEALERENAELKKKPVSKPVSSTALDAKLRLANLDRPIDDQGSRSDRAIPHAASRRSKCSISTDHLTWAN